LNSKARESTGNGPETIAAMGISQAMEGRRVLEHLSVEENLWSAPTAERPGGVKKDWNWFLITSRRSELRQRT
jgi:ABC-type branched-subunit amino acid transport system ATPase component